MCSPTARWSESQDEETTTEPVIISASRSAIPTGDYCHFRACRLSFGAPDPRRGGLMPLRQFHSEFINVKGCPAVSEGWGFLNSQRGESFRAVFHNQAGRLGNRSGAEPADRRSPRWFAYARKSPHASRLRSTPASSAKRLKVFCVARSRAD